MGVPDAPIDPTTLEYRPLRVSDKLAQVVRLFELAGWGPLTEADVESWIRDDPQGEWLVMVAADEPRHELLGVSMYSPHRVQLFDRVGLACRARSVVLDPRLRRAARGTDAVTEDDPLRRMVLASRPLRNELGWEFTFSLPNPKMTRRSELHTYADDAASDRITLGNGLRIELQDGPSMAGAVAAAESAPGAEYDELWQAAREGLGIECAVVRDATAVGRRPGVRLELRRPGTGALRGYAVFSDDAGGKMEDVLAEDTDAMHELLAGAVGWLRANPTVHELEFFNSLPHPMYRDALLALGAAEVDWLFAFSVTAHPPRTAPELVASRWYVTIGD